MSGHCIYTHTPPEYKEFKPNWEVIHFQQYYLFEQYSSITALCIYIIGAFNKFITSCSVVVKLLLHVISSEEN